MPELRNVRAPRSSHHEEVQGAIRKDHRDMRREQYQARRVKFKVRRAIETVRDFKYLGRITVMTTTTYQQ
jgi:hypothetical protein